MDISIIAIGVASLLYEALPVALDNDNNKRVHKGILIISLLMIFGSLFIEFE